MAKKSSANDHHWDDYTNLQRVKHELIRTYLNGWFPKITKFNQRVIFFDTHAGRGRYDSGQAGSPIVALNTLLSHTFLPMLTANSECIFTFFEEDKSNIDSLNREIASVGALPKNVIVHAEEGNCFQIIDNAITDLENKGVSLAPSFVFCDPFGFKIPGSLLRRLMSFRRVELFVNIIWRNLDMGMGHGRRGVIKPGMKKTIDDIFDGHDWLSEIDGNANENERADQCANLLKKVVGAEWATYIRMERRGRTSYFLLHLTNHEQGRDLMKECIWKACPDGGYFVRQSDDPSQQRLIKPEPDWEPIQDWVRFQLHSQPRRWQELHDLVRHELWLKQHINKVVRNFRKTQEIVAEVPAGRTFNPASNPLLRLIPT